MSLNILFNKSDQNPLSNLVFFEIVTATKYMDLQQFMDNEPTVYQQWLQAYNRNDDKQEGVTMNEYYKTKSCFNPLYARVVGAAIGAFSKENDEIKIKKISSNDENEILGQITSIFYNAYDKGKILAAHNISGYHIPFYTKRLLCQENANKILAKDLKGEKVIASIPAIIREHLFAKTWEQKTVDTMQLIRFGSPYNTSLVQACLFFGIKPPSTDKDTATDEYYAPRHANGVTSAEVLGNIAHDHVRATMELYKHLRETV